MLSYKGLQSQSAILPTLEPTEEALARKVKVVQLQLHAALQNQNAAVFHFQKYFQYIFSQFIIDFEHTE